MAIKPSSVSSIDGIKLNFGDGWLLTRVSGTVPKIRVTAEAKSETRNRKLYNSGIDAFKECRDTGQNTPKYGLM